MQQLFMIISFRQGIFNIPVLGDNKDESFLYQLRVIFGNLQESKKVYYDPGQFHHAYEDYDG